MDRSDLDRAALTALAVGLCGGLLAWRPLGPEWAFGLVLSTLWGAANVWLLGQVIFACTGERVSALSRGLVLLAKAACLFGGGAVLVLSPFFSPLPFLLGIHVIFGVLALMTARRAFTSPFPLGKGVGGLGR
jgi:hypothetical protein